MTMLECGGGAEGRKREIIQNTGFTDCSLFSGRCAMYKPYCIVLFIKTYPHKEIYTHSTQVNVLSLMLFLLTVKHAQCTRKPVVQTLSKNWLNPTSNYKN